METLQRFSSKIKIKWDFDALGRQVGSRNGRPRLEDHLPSWKGEQEAGLSGPENLEVDGKRGDDREQLGQLGNQ